LEQSLGYKPALPEDLPSITSLLESSSLPIEGVREAIGNFTVAETADGRVVGAGGFEMHGRSCLLRSVVVDPRYRNLGVGQRLVEMVLRRAAAQGAEVCYLLTQTANEYFKRFGFVPVARDQVDEGIKESEEFRVLCDTTAVVMSRRLI